METVRDFADVSQGHTIFEGGAKRLLGKGIVEGRVEPLRPLLLERDLRLDCVTDVKSRGQARFQGTLAQQASREAVQRLNGCLVEIVDRTSASLTLRLLPASVAADPFERLSDT